MLTAFKQYLLTLKLSRVSRKLYLSDVIKFLSFLGTDPGLDLVTSSSSYLGYLDALRAQAVAPSMIKRISASLKQFASFIALTYAVTNPLTNASDKIESPEDKYIKHFTNYLNREQLSPLTIKSYKSDTSLYLDWVLVNLPSTKISEVLTEKNIEKYLNYLRQSQTSSISTIERKSKSLARFKDWYLNNYSSKPVTDNKQDLVLESQAAQFDSSTPSISDVSTIPTLPPLITPDKASKSVKNFNYRTALSFIILMTFAATLGIFGYRQFSQDVKLTAAYPSTPVTPNRQLSFQGRLENAGGTPITTATNLTFKLYDAASAGTQLYTTGVCSITPDADGVFSTQIGSTCGSAIASTVFSENASVWLEVTVASEILSPRQPIASVAYALNSETIQGFPISSTVSAIRNTVVPMNQWGEIIVGEQNPRLKGVSGTFQISAPSLSFITTTGSNGNINFAPDGTGQINATGNTTTTNFFSIINSQLTTGSLITGTAANNNSGFKLLDLLSGSSPTSKFSVSDAGNVTMAGDLTVTGDDIFMNTNTAGMLLIADGTNFNPTAMSGDITINGSGVTSIGADKITESMLKSVNLPTDELCLSYESTVGDFEWQTCGSGSGSSNWRSNLGALSPLNDTWDLLVGGIATSSAKAGFININSGTPTATVSAGTSGGAYLSASGTLATTAKQTLTIGNSTTGNINIGVGAGDLLIGESGTAVDIHFAESANIEADAGKHITLTDIGNITPDADSTYSLGASPTSAWLNIYGDNIYQNGNLVCDASGANCPASGINYWRSSLGALSPLSDSYDLLLGNAATSSAKAGFININSGTPTATVSAGTAGGSFLTANGYLSTTARQSLTLGNSSTFNTTGNILLNPNGIGKIGVGTTNPGYTLDLNTTSSSRAVNVNNIQTSSSNIYGVYGSANVTDGTYTASSYGGYFSADQTSADKSYGIYAVATGTDNDGSLTGVFGEATNGTGVHGLGNTGGYFLGTAMGMYAGASTPTNAIGALIASSGTSTPFGLQVQTNGGDATGIYNATTNTTVTTSGTDTTYGELNLLSRTGATGGTIDTYGSYIGVSGDNAGSGTHTAYGLYVDMAAGPDNIYAGIFNGGNVGIGTSAPSERLDVVGNATASGNITMGGQLQLGRFATTPTAIGSGAMIFNTTSNTNQCYNGTVWYNCGGALYSNTNASVADGSYITVAHNLANTDLLSGAWINSQGVWKSLDANYKPAIAWEGKDTEKGIYHNEVNKYVPTTETGTGTNTLNEGLIFDTLEDSTKTDSANTTASVALQIGDDGSANFATLNQRVQSGRTGLVGGQTLATSTTDNDGQTYLGSNTVNDMYYYDRSKDSVPAVLVELGIDPNWYNGVTLSVATSSATYSQNGTIADKNPNLTPTYNGSLIKATGTDSTPRTIYITIKSPTTFDWTNYQGDSATGVTITPGIAQSLGATGVSATFSSASYNVGDVFKIASWFIEGESATRGAKQQFPERSNIVVNGDYTSIIDADTQKLWMSAQAVSWKAATSPDAATMLNGTLYIAANNSGSSDGNVRVLDFVHDDDKYYYETNTYRATGAFTGVAGRNTAGANNIAIAPVGIVTRYANDVAAAVIPNQPTQEVTVSGWGYIQGNGTTTVNETVNLPYKFNNIPSVVANTSGANFSSVAPTSLAGCSNSGTGGINTGVYPLDNSTFGVAVRHNDNATLLASTWYICYTWTATGTVSPKQFVTVSTGATSADGGVTIINETDGTKADIAIGSQHALVLWSNKLAFAGNSLYYSVNDSTSNATYLFHNSNVHGLQTETSWTQYLNQYYGVGTAAGPSGYIIGTATGTNQITSIQGKENTSTNNDTSNAIYIGTTSGVTVLNEYEDHSTGTDATSVTQPMSSKYYTKDYVSEEMVGNVRSMWPLNNNNTASDFEDVSINAKNLTGTNITAGGDSVSGVRGTATDFDGSTEYMTTANDPYSNAQVATGSVSWWFKTSATSGTMFSDEGWFAGGITASGKLNAYTDGAGVGFNSNMTVNDNNWHFGTITWSSTVTNIYIDGVLDTTGTPAGAPTPDSTATRSFGIGAQWNGTTKYAGYIDDLAFTSNMLTPGQIKNMYQVGYRALQSHGTTLGGGSADTNQQLGYISTGTSSVGAVAVDTNNQYMYVGTNSTTLGALSKIELNSDTNIKTYNSSANVPTGGALLLDEDVTSLSVGETLNAAGSAASGVKTIGLDNNATATSGNFVSKTYALPKNIGSAVLWVSGVTDSGDGSNTLTVKASNDNGATYATCSLVTTDSNPTVPEKEYACTFTAADNDLKVKFEFVRGSTKTNTYVVQYGISWLGETGFRIEQADSNNVRLYNFSGETQNLKLNVTGASAATLASPWTDAGSYLYPTGFETLRVYDGAGSNYLALSDAYINFGATSGSSGYGIRDNAGTMEFKNLSGAWTAMGTGGGVSWWDQTAGTLQPYNKTVDLLLGSTATASAKIALINVNSGTPTATISAGTSGGIYINASGKIATTAKQTLALGDSTTTGNIILQGGNVGIGVASPTQKLEVAGYVVGQRFEDSASSTYFIDPAATGTSISIDGNIVSDGAFSITSNATNGNVTIDAGSGTVLIGSAGAGKLDAGTIDPPYTINGDKFATYMAGMTGVKEETTGVVKATEYISGKGYRATLDFAGSLTGSDLWLFSKASNLKNKLDKLVVLLSSSSTGKTWYELDALSGKLHLYSQTPTTISYRLTAPRYDDTAWLNTRDASSTSVGHVINDDNNWSISQEIANLFSGSEVVSPLGENQPTTITGPVAIKSNDSSSIEPVLQVDGELEASTISARVAQLDTITADSITAKNIVADSITANTIVGLDARIASLSGISDQEFESITDRIKNRLASIVSPTPTAQDIPVTTYTQTDSLNIVPVATTAATIASADIDFATVNNYLAVIGEATITSLNVTTGLYVDSIDSKSGRIALAEGTLIIDSVGQVAINGDLTVSGKVLADSASLNTLELGTPSTATSSALGKLLSVYNENGIAVATIDASGSANLASLTTSMITIASPADATSSSLLSSNISSNATAGESVLTSPNTEIVITSPYVTKDTLVYLTPTTNTDNKVLFVKSKFTCENAQTPCTPSFTVAIDSASTTDISFNWWIIELAKAKDASL